MALQSSGLIRLAGNTTGRSVAKELLLGTSGVHTPTISLGQNNVRALAQRTGSVSVGLGHLRGKSAAIETQTVTVGYLTPSQYTPGGYGLTAGDIFSSIRPHTAGSISDGTFNIKNNASIGDLHWNNNSNQVRFLINTGNATVTNSGFTTMTVNGVAFARSAATFATNITSGTTQWYWSSSTNPFGTTIGATKSVVFS